MQSSLLSVQNLSVSFNTDYGKIVAVDDLTVSVEMGQTLGIVGESGSGKSVTSLAIMRLLPDRITQIHRNSKILLGDENLLTASEERMREIRGSDISIIFQEPTKCLNPVMKVGLQVMEAILTHERTSKLEAKRQTIELFREVGIPDPENRINMYPHEMSGGQQQRVMIAMALSSNPKLLIADEPTTALDVTIQAQILELLRNLKNNRGMGLIFISHDLGVISDIADVVAIMQSAKLIEMAPINEIFENPKQAYTKGLLACRPKLAGQKRRLQTISNFIDATKDAKLINENRDLNNKNDINNKSLLYPLNRLRELGFSGNTQDYPQGTRFAPETESPLLQVKDIHVYFQMRGGIFRKVTKVIKANENVSFDVYKGQTLGLVGESGCGKTTLGRAVMRLIETNQGSVTYKGTNLTKLTAKSLRPFRKNLQIIFQDPYGSLNPRMTTEDALVEPMLIHKIGESYDERKQMTLDLLAKVGMDDEGYLSRYPHEFSGGQRQRICIARALAVQPELIVCDESVSALDVSVQAQVLNLLKDLQDDLGLSYIFISHDLSVVKFMSDMMAVMNEGNIVEFGPAESIYNEPKHDYTKRLIESIPEETP